MKLEAQIALRYLFAKKSQNIINVISMISVFGVLIGTIGLVLILSVFNGLHGLVGDMYSTFDPEIKISPAKGKVFSTDTLDLSGLKQMEEITTISQWLTDHALLKYDKKQVPGMVMGVDTLFSKVTRIDSIIIDGNFNRKKKGSHLGVVGTLLADQLGLRPTFVTPLMIYTPRRKGKINMANPTASFRNEYINPSGIFAVRQIEYDSQYIVIDISLARQLFEYAPNTVSCLALKIKEDEDIDAVGKKIAQLLGENYLVENREQQHATFYKMMHVEKIVAYLILSFILIIATFNIIGTLSMLIFEKRENITTLRSMGATQSMITRIFLLEGWFISLSGLIIGLIISSTLVWLQETFGIIHFLGEGTFVVDAYPVELKWQDAVTVFVTVASMGFLSAWYPVKVIVKRYYSVREE